MKKKYKGRVIIFAGPSGSGKDTVLNKVLEKSENSVKLTTATTREPREGEIDGIDYYFISRDDFEEGIEKGLIPEHNEHAGNLYGIYLPDLEKKLKKGKNVLGQVQLIGAKYLKENYDAVTLFINADSLEILEERIRDRSNLPEEEIEERIRVARREVKEEASFYDYQIINRQGKLDETVDEVIAILEKEGVEL